MFLVLLYKQLVPADKFSTAYFVGFPTKLVLVQAARAPENVRDELLVAVALVSHYRRRHSEEQHDYTLRTTHVLSEWHHLATSRHTYASCDVGLVSVAVW